jgi:hypothetical protein
MKDLGEKYPTVLATIRREAADYVLLFEHEPGKGALRHDSKWAVFLQAGDMLKSGATRSKGGAVEAACRAIVADWTARAVMPKASTTPEPTPRPTSQP